MTKLEHTMLSFEYIGFTMAILDGNKLSDAQAKRFAEIKEILTKAGKL